MEYVPTEWLAEITRGNIIPFLFVVVMCIEMLYVFFWVIPRRLNFICRRFGTLCLFHLHRQVDVEFLHLPAYEEGTDRVFRNVGI